MKTTVIILVAMLMLAVCGVLRLDVRYGHSWKIKNLQPFDKAVFVYICVAIALWVAAIGYLVFQAV